jgi:predicted N-acyltransferase
VVGALGDVPQAAWDALVADRSPFLEWEWLHALEETAAVGAKTGWLPQHLTMWEGEELVGACPLYVKAHSQGEFVFDHGWATAAQRARIPYYPKLLVAVPFTPVTGPRILAAPGTHGQVAAEIAGALERVCEEQGFSSVHVNFCLDEDREALEARGWLPRIGYQYHWVNRGFGSFDDYLESLRSKRRNQVRRERRELAEQGVTIETLVGEAIYDYASATAAAGDVDADGLRDILIGAFRQEDDLDRTGAAYLVHGGVTGTLLLSMAHQCLSRCSL